MCGICGVIDFHKRRQITLKMIADMTTSLRHRGPDAEGYLVGCNSSYAPIYSSSDFVAMRASQPFDVALGHRRLSIIDLSTGHQPMTNEDGTIWIIFNGEIYNYQQLRAELLQKGHQFSTNSDTEVIIHTYEEYGEDCSIHLNGMFAFAIWDTKEEKLFIARDRVGIKPLIYTEVDGFFLFGSELKSILASGLVKPEVDNVALHHYLTYQYVPHPMTMFKGIQKLLPGYSLIYANGKTTLKQYWDVTFEDKPDKGIEFYKSRIRELLEDSVKIRLMSDVPLGAFLSGGIDSSTVVAMMSQAMKEPVKTFSIGFEEKSYNEVDYARIIAKRFQTDHHEFIVTPKDMLASLPALMEQFDEPFADSSAIPTFMVSKLARQHVTVVLSGDGGDEIFAGYPRYQFMRLITAVNILPNNLNRVLYPVFRKSLITVSKLYSKDFSQRLERNLTPTIKKNPEMFFHIMSYFKPEMKQRLYSSDFAREITSYQEMDFFNHILKYCHVKAFINKLLFLEFKTYLPNDILVKVDITSMANSLEVRVPFLDYRIVEFMATVPFKYKLRGLTTKYILKQLLANLLPKEILYRKKKGFHVPIREWFRNELSDYLRDILLSQSFKERGHFNSGYVQQLIEKHQASISDYSYPLWALLNLELWFRIWKA